SSALDRPRADQCWSNAAQARRAPTRDRELPRSAEPDGRPALRPRGRTHRTADPAHPCSAPSSKLSVDGRFTSTESRFALLLKTVLQHNRPQAAVEEGMLFRRCQGRSRHLENGAKTTLMTHSGHPANQTSGSPRRFICAARVPRSIVPLVEDVTSVPWAP